jgi:hypothetical protein
MSEIQDQPVANPDAKLQAAAVRTSGKWRRRFARLGVVLIIAMIALELGLRFGLGLGDPPLLQSDPKIEYLYQPNQTIRRFGHALHFNAYSMRSDDFPEHKSSPDELRIFMIGDSVINGGVPTDQSAIASTIIQRELSQKLGRKVIVGNASASSWGPPNELAYMERYPTLFDADVVVIVVSSHDVVDVPTFQANVGVNPNMPDHKPISAIEELITRYLLPRMGMGALAGDAPPPAPTTQPTLNDPDVRQCLDALRRMIAMGKSIGARVLVVQHIERAEANGHLLPGHDLFMNAAKDAGAEVVQLAPGFDASLAAGKNPWRDIIHPNETGQRTIADVLEPILMNGERK